MALMDEILNVMKYVGGMSPRTLAKTKADLAGGRFKGAEVLQGDAANNPQGIIRMLTSLGKGGKGINGMKGVLRLEGTQAPITGAYGHMAELDMPKVVDLGRPIITKTGKTTLNGVLQEMQKSAAANKGGERAVDLNLIVDFMNRFGTKGLE